MHSDLTIKCRGCLAEEPEMHNLFYLVTDDLTLANILSETTSTLIEENKEISPYLCLKCTATVVDFYNFKIEFEKSQAYFQSELEKYKDDSVIRLVAKDDISVSYQVISEKENKNFHSDNVKDINNELLERPKCGERIKTGNEIDLDKALPSSSSLHLSTIAANSQNREQKDTFNKVIEEINKQVMPEVGEFTVQNELVQLIESVVFCCKTCNEEYLLKDDFLLHMSLKHDKTKVDASKFTKKTLVKLPLSNVKVENCDYELDIEQEENTLCKICKVFVSRAEFESHYNEHKIFACTCGARFLKKRDLFNHGMSVHSELRRFVCEYCNKAFKLKQGLSKHRKYHTHPRSEMCHMCGKAFNDKSVLKTHIQLKHFPTWDFQCNHCGLSFSLKSTLFKHIRRHHTSNRKRPFSCAMCNVAYFDKTTLNRHIAVKHSDNPVKANCEYCRKSFTTKSNLFKHIRTTHRLAGVVIRSDGKDIVKNAGEILKTHSVGEQLNFVLQQ